MFAANFTMGDSEVDLMIGLGTGADAEGGGENNGQSAAKESPDADADGEEAPPPFDEALSLCKHDAADEHGVCVCVF